MRTVVALLLSLLVSPAFAADDRLAVIEGLGAVSIAPQICGVAIDRAALADVGRKLLPDEPELTVATFRVNDRIAEESRGWSAADRAAWCRTTAALADKLGVLR